MRSLALAIGIAATAAVLPHAPAAAAIRCDGPVQIISGGNSQPTPYCEDAYLAQVARQHGVSVSATAIRASYNKKSRICELIGNDTRVSSICTGHRPVDRRGGTVWF